MEKKEALKILKEFHDKSALFSVRTALDTVIPELKESEDEKIRKSLIDFLKSPFVNENITDEKVTPWIAWLEKQGDHKHADKIGPKFNVGDWITNGEYTWQVTSIGQLDYILQSQDRDAIVDTISHVNEHFHLWTIQDAKDGDVLEFGDHGRLVIGIVSHLNKVTGKVDVNCLLEDNNFKLGNYYVLDTIKPHPATKEQRDRLFQKMKEVEYEWDAEKKELKKIYYKKESL